MKRVHLTVVALTALVFAAPPPTALGESVKRGPKKPAPSSKKAAPIRLTRLPKLTKFEFGPRIRLTRLARRLRFPLFPRPHLTDYSLASARSAVGKAGSLTVDELARCLFVIETEAGMGA